MTHIELVNELSKYIPSELAEDIVQQFIVIKQDVATNTLERSAPGKFVETTVQILQYLSDGNYNNSFKTGEIDDFLKNTEARAVNLPPDLKINVTRIARGMYSIRSKRSIIHKGIVNPNIYDLRYLYSSAQWILCEIICHVFQSDINTVGRLVEFIQVPATSIVEDFGERRLVLASCTAAEELLVLLLNYYPGLVKTTQLRRDMDRRAPTTVTNTIRSLHNQRMIEGNITNGYKLTKLGHQRAIIVVEKITIS